MKKVKTIEKLPQHWFERVLKKEINKWLFSKNPPPLAEIAMFEVQLDTDAKMFFRCPVLFTFPQKIGKKYDYMVSIPETERERLDEIWEKEPQKM